MCTLISYWDSNRLLLGMNRDNPLDRTHSGWIETNNTFYPVDPTSEGTWIGVTVDGVVAALLYGANAKSGEKSRGDIVPYALMYGIPPRDASLYGTFQLFVYARGEAGLFVSDGHNIERLRPKCPLVLTSSSYGVASQKRKIVNDSLNYNPTSESLMDLLKSHEPERGITSACMHGPESETIASTIIDARKNHISIYDAIGSPCANEYAHFKELAKSAF